MTSMDIEVVDLTDLIGDHEIPCDYAEHSSCSKLRAEWVLYRAVGVCRCGRTGAALACTRCKEHRLAEDTTVMCHDCHDYITPARKAYCRVEAL